MYWITEKYSQDKSQLTLDCTYHYLKAMQPLDAALLTVQHIVDNYPAPYTLMVSGGIDSQAMLWAWHQSGQPFTALSGRYNTDMNAHDHVQLLEFAEHHNITVDFLDLDLLDFFANEYSTWADKYQCDSPQICAHMRIASAVTAGTVILSGNFLEKTHPALTYAILGMKRYAEQSGQSMVPFFFLETPELAYSFISILDSSNSAAAYQRRVEAYWSAGFPVGPQCRKYTGFEKYKDYYDQLGHLVPVTDRLEFVGKPSDRVFDQLLRYPYERKFKPPTLTFIMQDTVLIVDNPT